MPKADISVIFKAEMGDYIKGIGQLMEALENFSIVTETAWLKWKRAFPDVPFPKIGGTFFYCTYREDFPGGATTCGIPHSRYVGSRFRTAAKYRRHWRKAHS
jgi:hypothetical protein